jgi:hypothetical protein
MRPGVKVKIAIEIQAESAAGFDDGAARGEGELQRAEVQERRVRVERINGGCWFLALTFDRYQRMGLRTFGTGDGVCSGYCRQEKRPGGHPSLSIWWWTATQNTTAMLSGGGNRSGRA